MMRSRDLRGLERRDLGGYPGAGARLLGAGDGRGGARRLRSSEAAPTPCPVYSYLRRRPVAETRGGRRKRSARDQPPALAPPYL